MRLNSKTMTGRHGRSGLLIVLLGTGSRWLTHGEEAMRTAKAAPYSVHYHLGFDRNTYPGDAALPGLRKTFVANPRREARATLASPAPSSPNESLRAELVRLQQQTGLTLVSVGKAAVEIVVFADRSLRKARPFISDGTAMAGAISPDGTEIAFSLYSQTGRGVRSPSGIETPRPRSYLAIIRQDGTDLRKYPDFTVPSRICWSPDKSKLAMDAKNERNHGLPSLNILTLSSGPTQKVDVWASVTSQCWSPDGKQIVYGQFEPEGKRRTVLVYDIEQDKSRMLAKGVFPTWSPDGNWVAFLDHDTYSYYAIRPSGNERKLLFRKTFADTGLWWSPDSRLVAYVSARGLFEKPLWNLEELGRLRVRRLDDNSEAWVANLSELDPIEFQWVKNAELNTH